MALNGQQLPFHHCRHLAHSMDMKDKPIDEALRTFQKLFLMPVSQVIVCTCVYLQHTLCTVSVHVCGVYLYMYMCVYVCVLTWVSTCKCVS